MKLNELKIGQCARITSVGGEGALRQHFLDMGVIPGAEVTLVKLAPMGDPMELQIHGYELTLRVADAGEITIDPIDERTRKHERPDRIYKSDHPGLGETGKYHAKGDGEKLPEGTKLTFALVGNQNCGKTTLFNQLTGSNQHVGNFPGVTVDCKSGMIKGHENTSVTDLPGIYSMSPYSSEEIVSRNFVLNEKPKAIINIVDATNIERNLYLTMQLLEMDIPMVVALNMFSQGIDPELDFSNINECIDIYEASTGLDVHPRHPYAGDLVYTAFSGSHQDAIKKGMAKMIEHPDRWEVPYLPIDPLDVGRNYDPIIRINSQSGKGGVAYILETHYGLHIPKIMQQDFGPKVTQASVDMDKELTHEEIYNLFMENYYIKEPLSVLYYTEESSDDHVNLDARVNYRGREMSLKGNGNGIVDAFCKAIMDEFGVTFEISDYSQHSLAYGNKSKAITYVQVYDCKKQPHFAVGISSNTAKSSIRAIASAINQFKKI